LKLSDSRFNWVLNPSEKDWSQLVKQSPQGNLFNESVYLKFASANCEKFLISQGSEIKAGVCIVKGGGSRECKLDQLVIHNGILFSPNPQKKRVKQCFEQFELTEYIIHQLSLRFDSIELALSPFFKDLRPFLWYRYHSGNLDDRFDLDLRYTTFIDISSLDSNIAAEKTKAFINLEVLRQRHIRQAYKSGGIVNKTRSANRLIDFYRDLMSRQNQPPSEVQLSRIQSLIEGLVISEKGAIYEVKNSDGIVLYVIAYGWDSKRAYFLFGAGNSLVNEPWQGTLGHWEAFKDLAININIKEVDMEGVNSPQRGWFKMSFGGRLMPYYQIYKHPAN
jgi:hypothetical protein